VVLRRSSEQLVAHGTSHEVCVKAERLGEGGDR
jgi:hypothetical protein